MNRSEINTQYASATRAPRRRASRLAAVLGSIAMAAVASAEPTLGTIEECLESGTDLVTLPGVAGGSLSASECRGCPSLRLKFDPGTRYYIGKEAVPYARLREAAAKAPVRLYVFYRPQTKTLTRLRHVATGK
jgi:hypothetical protein